MPANIFEGVFYFFTSVMYVCRKELVVHTQIRTSAMVDAFLTLRHHRGIL
jgi:hypothetical protein